MMCSKAVPPCLLPEAMKMMNACHAQLGVFLQVLEVLISYFQWLKWKLLRCFFF